VDIKKKIFSLHENFIIRQVAQDFQNCVDSLHYLIKFWFNWLRHHWVRHQTTATFISKLPIDK